MILEKGNILSDYNRWLKAYLRNAKHREVSKNSMLVYNRILHKLKDYIVEQGEVQQLKEIDQEFILSFLEYFEDSSKKQNFSTKTKTLYISILKSFFVYISDNNDEFYTYEKEFKGIMPKKINRRKKINYLSDNDVNTILKYLNNNLIDSRKHYNYIHALGIKLMLFSGLRVSEVLHLKLGNIKVSELTNSEGIKDFYEIHLEDTKSKEEQTALIKIKNIEKEINYFKMLYKNHEYFFKGKIVKSLLIEVIFM